MSSVRAPIRPSQTSRRRGLRLADAARSDCDSRLLPIRLAPPKEECRVEVRAPVATQGFRETSARRISQAFAASSMMADAVTSSSNAATLMARTTAGSIEIRNWRFSPDGGRLPFREVFFIVIPRVGHSSNKAGRSGK
jgi:hypothetical protein